MDEVLKATSLPLLPLVVACSKRHCAREAADFLLLLFLRPHTTEQGTGNTNPGGSQGSLLGEPFTAPHYHLHTELQDQQVRRKGHSFHTGELKQRQKKDRNIEMLWMFVYEQHIPSAAKKLKKIPVIKRKSTVETILKKILTPEKKKQHLLTIY